MFFCLFILFDYLLVLLYETISLIIMRIYDKQSIIIQKCIEKNHEKILNYPVYLETNRLFLRHLFHLRSPSTV